MDPAPSGGVNQVAAVADLISGNSSEPPKKEEQLEDVPEQAALGENLEEGAVENGGEAPETTEQTEQAASGEIRTLVDFAKAAGWSPEELYNLEIKLDTGDAISLGAVKDKLQAYTRKEADLEAQREALVQEQQTLRQQVQQTMQGQQSMSQAALETYGAMQAIQAKYNEIDWEALGNSDPGRAALLQQKIASEYAGAKQAHSQAIQQQQLQQQHYWNQAIVESDQKFLQAVPEWKDEKVASVEGPAISRFLMEKIGFAPDELATIIDPRARVVARMAWQWMQHQGKVAQATAKVRNAPKPVMRPGNGVQGGIVNRQVDSLMQKAKTTGKRGDQISAVSALLNL